MLWFAEAESDLRAEPERWRLPGSRGKVLAGESSLSCAIRRTRKCAWNVCERRKFASRSSCDKHNTSVCQGCLYHPKSGVPWHIHARSVSRFNWREKQNLRFDANVYRRTYLQDLDIAGGEPSSVSITLSLPPTSRKSLDHSDNLPDIEAQSLLVLIRAKRVQTSVVRSRHRTAGRTKGRSFCG